VTAVEKQNTGQPAGDYLHEWVRKPYDALRQALVSVLTEPMQNQHTQRCARAATDPRCISRSRIRGGRAERTRVSTPLDSHALKLFDSTREGIFLPLSVPYQ